MSYTLSEHESKQLLRAAGIPVPEDRLCDDAESAVRAAEALGLPVALKLCGRKIAHKTERGLVRLGLAAADAVRAAANELLAARRAEDGDAKLLVTRMVSGRREVIAGLVRDPQFGPCVMLGLGGIFAEALGDVAFAAAPLARGDAADLIDALATKQLLGPFRGEPAVDRAALARVLDALGKLGAARPDVRSIDVNPLIVSGAEPVVIDALVELEGEPA
ncbi:MAG TPA: acetate--CoA ligase family protein [Myxococcota bacterium]|nr:acetate--CoA ligase family protein [Myxococcota bacterium]